MSGGVLGGARAADRALADVAREHLDRPRCSRAPPGTRALRWRASTASSPGGAPRDPDPEGGVAAARALEQRREHVRLERGEHLRIAEEARHVDEQVVVQRVQLLRILAERAAGTRRRSARGRAPSGARSGAAASWACSARRPRRSAPSGGAGSSGTSCRPRARRGSPSDRTAPRRRARAPRCPRRSPPAGQDQIDDVRLDGAPRHPVVHRGRGVLRVRPAAAPPGSPSVRACRPSPCPTGRRRWRPPSARPRASA